MPSSKTTVPPGSKPVIFFPKRISTPSSPSIFWMAATAFFPMRSPGLGMGAKKASWKLLADARASAEQVDHVEHHLEDRPSPDRRGVLGVAAEAHGDPAASARR